VLSDDNHRQLYVPEGFAHGFCVLSETADFGYKCSDYYDSSSECGIVWNDPDIGIAWPREALAVSSKDAALPRLSEQPPDRLPVYHG
jgi:dTDP-4-dehydrorhamnose 3,5-epimerase